MLEFRPHHFLCTLGFEGKGYSEAFVRGFARIASALRDSPETGDQTEILVVDSADAICMPCPNRHGRGCLSGEKISKLDRAHAEILGVKPGDRITWGEAKKLLVEKMDLPAFDRACASCSWKSLGVCEAALKRLRNSRGLPMIMATLTIALGLAFAFAKPLYADSSPQPEPSPQPLDTLQEKLHPAQVTPLKKGKKTKKAKPASSGHSDVSGKIKKGYEHLLQGKTAEAGHLAAAVQRDPLFGDYGYWLASLSTLQAARSAYQAKKYDRAMALADASIHHSMRILGDYPYSPFIKSAQKEIASAELVKGGVRCARKKWASCIEIFEGAFQRFVVGAPNNGKAELAGISPEMLQAYGQACTKAGSERCLAWLSRLGVLFPKTSPEYRALTKYLPGGRERQKLLGGGARMTKAYRAPDPDQVALDEGLSEYFEKKYASAVRKFQQLLDEFPRSAYRYRARYWLARALENDGMSVEAQKVHESLAADSPLTYYGMLASIAKGKDIGARIAGTVPEGLTRDPGLSPLEIHRLKRAEILLQGGAGSVASFELRDLKARDAHASPFLMYLTLLENEAGNHVVAFSILSELIQRGYPAVYSTYVLKYIFPTPFLDIIEKSAKEYSLDPILLLSLVKQESSFDPSAISSSGAQGLTQLMPLTALDISPGVMRSELLDARTNIRMGAKYLAKLLNRFNGNIVLALASYNAGASAVDRWIKANSQRTDMLEFIEAIPYRETREYVAGIVRNYFWYSRFLKKAPAPVPPVSPRKVVDEAVDGLKAAEPDKNEALALDYFWSPYKPLEKQIKAD